MKYIIPILLLLLAPFCYAGFVEDGNGSYIYGYPSTSLAKMQYTGMYWHTLYREYYNNLTTAQRVHIAVDFGQCNISNESQLYETFYKWNISIIGNLTNITGFNYSIRHWVNYTNLTHYNNGTHNIWYKQYIDVEPQSYYVLEMDIGTICEQLKYDNVVWKCDEDNTFLCYPNQSVYWRIYDDPIIDASKISEKSACIGVNTWDNCTFPSQYVGATDLFFRNFTYSTNNQVTAVKDAILYSANNSVHEYVGDVDDALYNNDWGMYFPLNFNAYDIAGNMSQTNDCTPNTENYSLSSFDYYQLSDPQFNGVTFFKYNNITQDWYFQNPFTRQYTATYGSNRLYWNAAGHGNTLNATCNINVNITETQNLFMATTFAVNTSASADSNTGIWLNYFSQAGTMAYCVLNLYKDAGKGQFQCAYHMLNGTNLYWANTDDLKINTSFTIDNNKKYLFWTHFSKDGNYLRLRFGLDNTVYFNGLSVQENLEGLSSHYYQQFECGGNTRGFGIEFYNAMINRGTFSQGWLDSLSGRLLNTLNIADYGLQQVYINRTIFDRNEVMSTNQTQNISIFFDSLNIYAKNSISYSTINTFNATVVDDASAFYTTTVGLITATSLTEPYNITVMAEGYEPYYAYNLLIPIPNNYIAYMTPIAYVGGSFYNETTDLLFNGNIEMDIIFHNYSDHKSISGGQFNFSTLYEGDYVFRYWTPVVNYLKPAINRTVCATVLNESHNPDENTTYYKYINYCYYDYTGGDNVTASLYTVRNYHVTLNTTSAATLKLYLLQNISSTKEDVTLTIVDQNNNRVEDVLVYVLKYFIAANQYKLVELTKTNFEGVAKIDIEVNHEYYKIMLVYQNEIKTISQPTYIYGDTLNMQIITGTLPLENFFITQGIGRTLTFNNATNYFTYLFSDLSGKVYRGCLYIYKLTAIEGKVLYNSSCIDSNTGTISLPVQAINGTSYEAVGTVGFNPTNQLVDKMIIAFSDIAELASLGMIFNLLLTLMFMGLAYWSVPFALIMTPMPSILLQILGFIKGDLWVYVGIELVAIVIAYVVWDRT